jgi:hypothetical protein
MDALTQRTCPDCHGTGCIKGPDDCRKCGGTGSVPLARVTPEEVAADDDQRIGKALHYASEYGYIDGAHHKQWVLDQMVRALTGCPMVQQTGIDYRGQTFTFEAQGESEEYREWLGGDDEGCGWDEGTAP